MAADQSIDHINTDAVLTSVVADAILLGPSGIQVLLPETVGVVLPTLGDFTLLDVFVLLTRKMILEKDMKLKWIFSCLKKSRLKTLKRWICENTYADISNPPSRRLQIATYSALASNPR